MSTKDVPDESVFIIQTQDGRGNGSGVLIAPNTILTARHVAEVAQYVPLYVRVEGKLYPARIHKLDHTSDLATMFVDGLFGKYATISRDVPEAGADVVASGFPMNWNIKALLQTKGEVLATVDDRLMTSATIMPGNSGGGLFQLKWYGRYELVGITVSVPMVAFGWSGIPAFHISNSVPANYIWLFLHDYTDIDG